MTSARRPTRWASTWAICGARPRSARSRASYTPCVAWATCCAADESTAMSFRRRITLVSSAAVAIAVVLASLLTYLITSHQLRGQVDTQLSNRADNLSFVARRPASHPSRSTLLALIKGQDPEQAQLTAGAGTQSSPLRNLPPSPNQVR